MRPDNELSGPPKTDAETEAHRALTSAATGSWEPESIGVRSKKIRAFGEGFEQRGAGVDGEVIRTAGGAEAADFGEITLDRLRVAGTNFVRFDEEFLRGLEVAQFDEAVQGQRDFGGVKHVKNGDVVAIVLEVLDAAGELRGRLEQVRDDDDEAALLEHFRRFMQRLLDVARAFRLDFFHLEQDGTQGLRAGDRRESLRDFIGEKRERGGIALADEQIHEAGGERAGVFEFCDGAGLAEMEAGGGIHEHRGAEAGLVLKTPDHVAIGFGKDLPVDQTGGVAFDVVTIFRELDGRAEIGRAVQALDAALHGPARGEAEAANLVRDAGREIFRGARRHEAVTKFPNFTKLLN
jgi:hypothetical protein